MAHVRAERDILALAKNPWIVELKCSFQDEKYLYLVMEFLQGGDLMTLLMERDILSEEESKFYIAETILAVESVHKLNYIHRDLKPDNLLIGRDGHIKLSDFGLCKHVEIKPRSETKVNESLRADGLTAESASKANLYNKRVSKAILVTILLLFRESSTNDPASWPIARSEHQTTSHQRSLARPATTRQLIGGVSARFCLSAWLATHHSSRMSHP